MEKPLQPRLDITGIREKLAGRTGRDYWRCFEEIAETPEFVAFLEDEFPQQARPLSQPVDRRQFLKLSGAGLALAGLAGCRYLPQRKIVPYVQPPEEVAVGKPSFYATAICEDGFAVGAIATSREGRPIKVDGNPAHPFSLGSTDALTQASLLNLYDPGRAQSVSNAGLIATWEEFTAAARNVVATEKAGKGAGIRILTETVTSPTLAAQLTHILNMFPAARWHQYEPVNRDNVRAGAIGAFGRPVNTIYRFDKANCILTLDGDFLLTMPGHVRYAGDFASRRRVHAGATTMSRLYAVESCPTVTGSMADHRLRSTQAGIEQAARMIAAAMGVPGVPAPDPNGPTFDQGWIAAVAKDLLANKGAAVVVPGDFQPAPVHALAHAMNSLLGAFGQTVELTDPPQANWVDEQASLKQLVADLNLNQVRLLLILGGNPVMTAPADLEFASALTRAPLRAHLSLQDDETSGLCQWGLPASHYLEAWSDARALDGTVSIVQPLVEPLFDTRSPHEVLSSIFDEPATGLATVRSYWERTRPSAEFDAWWEKTLRDGIVDKSALEPLSVSLAANWAADRPSMALNTPGGLELIFRPDPNIWDGRNANNPWLQELPKPVTHLVWDNAVFVSPKTAERMHLATGDVVTLEYRGHSVKGPISVLPGHADGCATVHFGYGRERGGMVGLNIGFNAFQLLTSDAPFGGAGAQITPTGDTYSLVSTHSRDVIKFERDPLQTITFADFLQNPTMGRNEEATVPPPDDQSLYSDAQRTDHAYSGFGDYQWGMSIDNNLCIGCNACAQACQAENNIPVVGKDQVRRAREMNWIRIDRYYKGSLDDPTTFFTPVPCMQCELAPCEPVCPVGATVHSHEGLNMMVYNRCVGTRYCSNNCPYKVRRFNFYKYTAGQPDHAPGNYDIPILRLSANPEVTIRGRGVMEKCTYCVQRIDNARIQAKNELRQIRDGEILTACQQACPTNAIVFGNIADPASKVSQLKSQPHNYTLLADLNTRPRTTYLSKVTNPNPEIANA
ncbi:MAG: TAT-variant-translocated molybdopterin oxidoreductase [Armatimonadetes bacterium]|nr:TAT-variant-translocated molybdopterin oxidoreductase [Armatimonadota bacterium]MDE2206824.1 TAT-variant-translocated molybdopterin oxidoreductase [Armatimonadota bacterium]